MKLGFVSAVLPDLSLSEILEFAASEELLVRGSHVLAPQQG